MRFGLNDPHEKKKFIPPEKLFKKTAPSFIQGETLAYGKKDGDSFFN